MCLWSAQPSFAEVVDNSGDFCGYLGLTIVHSLWITEGYLWITIVYAVDNSGDLWVIQGWAVYNLWISGRAGYLSLSLYGYLVAYHRIPRPYHSAMPYVSLTCCVYLGMP